MTTLRQRLGQMWAPIRAKLAPIWHRYQLTRALIFIFLALFMATSAYLTYVAKTANVGNLKAALSATPQVFDNKGDKAGELYSQKGTYVSYDEMSQNVRNAVLSSEDRNFYKEHGFSITGLGRAAVLFVGNKLTGKAGISGGGSTLTQQLVKNAYLSQEQTFTRKAKELFLSLEVEKNYSKNDILTMYLNNAWFGHGVWGVEDAAQKYFGVHASELTVEQSAMLAAMLPNPSLYNPIDHPQAAKTQRDIVLQTMVTNKKITQATAATAKATTLALNDTYDDSGDYQYPWYFDAVINEAINRYGLTENDVMNRGYKIYTSLDQTDQSNLQTDYDNDYLFNGQTAQAATIELDAKTGGVRAVIGGRGTHVFRGLNRAIQIRRSPGSTIKPLVVYTPALQRGYKIDDELPNKPISYGKYTPTNALGVETDDVPMYSALEHSYNVPAVYLLNKMGTNVGYAMAKKFELPVAKSDNNLALALGGMTNGVSPLQMAQAYTAFANDGTMSEAHFITKIVDATGKVIVSKPSTKQKRIMSTTVADNMTSMMLGTYTNGTGTSADPYGYTIAGKTGTTEDVTNSDNANSSTDSWVIGYTKDVVVASWMGYDNSKKGQYLPIYLQNTLGPLAKAYMEQILPNTENTNFTVENPNATSDDASSSASSSSSSDVWQQIQSGTQQAVEDAHDAASKAWSKVKSILGR